MPWPALCCPPANFPWAPSQGWPAVRYFCGCCTGGNNMPQCEGPQRIVCLTAETAETLYLLGEDRRIVGISGFTTRPKELLNRPKISTFTSAKIDRILELRP